MPLGSVEAFSFKVTLSFNIQLVFKTRNVLPIWVGVVTLTVNAVIVVGLVVPCIHGLLTSKASTVMSTKSAKCKR